MVVSTYRHINEYLAATHSENRSSEETCFIMKFSELSKSTTYQMPPCRKDFYQINLVQKAGVDRYHFNQTSKPQTENTLYFISPEHIYSWSRDDTLVGYLLYFKVELLVPYEKSIAETFSSLFSLQANNFLSLNQEEINQISLLFNSFHHHFYRTERSIALLRTLLLSLLFAIKSYQKAQPINRIDRKQQHFIAYQNLVNNCFWQHRDVQFYAQQLHLTPNYLNTICQRYASTTAKSIISKRLLQEAKYLLHSTAHDFAEIAYQLGFQYPSHFSRFFKQHTQKTPSEFRQNH
ncbi:MAG: helix-turn-helix domain-containing protein [Bacteroidota bacterium]